jgi:SpoVK/Ycf46/Vps4 family AAA+-type ATPase
MDIFLELESFLTNPIENEGDTIGNVHQVILEANAYSTIKEKILEYLGGYSTIQIIHITPWYIASNFPDRTLQALYSIFTHFYSSVTKSNRKIVLLLDSLNCYYPQKQQIKLFASKAKSSKTNKRFIHTLSDEEVAKFDFLYSICNWSYVFSKVNRCTGFILHLSESIDQFPPLFLRHIKHITQTLTYSDEFYIDRLHQLFKKCNFPDLIADFDFFLSSVRDYIVHSSAVRGFTEDDLTRIVGKMSMLVESSNDSSNVSVENALQVFKYLIEHQNPSSVYSTSKNNKRRDKKMIDVSFPGLVEFHDYHTQTSSTSGYQDNEKVSESLKQAKSAFIELEDDFDVDESDEADSTLMLHPSFISHLRASKPTVSWNEISGHSEIKLHLLTLIETMKMSRNGNSVSVTNPISPCILLYGPPGTGKTYLAKAIASSMNARFLSLPISSILKPGIGDSEQALITAFELAISATPSVIFLDELQALFGVRSHDSDTARFSSLLITQLLHCLDRIYRLFKTNEATVMVIAATNAPYALDQSLFHQGRFDTCMYVGLPTLEDIVEQYRNSFASLPITFDSQKELDETIQSLSEHSIGFSGADISNVIRRGIVNGLEKIHTSRSIPIACFKDAISKISPSIQMDEVMKTMRWKKNVTK